MDWKEFFKLKISKVALMLLLMILTTILSANESIEGTYLGGVYAGFPFAWLNILIYLGSSPVRFGLPHIQLKLFGTDFLLNSVVNLVLDLTFWYFVSCSIVWFFDKVKKKK